MAAKQKKIKSDSCMFSVRHSVLVRFLCKSTHSVCLVLFPFICEMSFKQKVSSHSYQLDQSISVLRVAGFD